MIRRVFAGKYVAILLIIVFCNIKLQGQDIAFDHLAVEHGLSHYSVLSITQDASGFMWLGTQRGLNRYDGVRFRLYKNDSRDTTTISNNDITSLFTDSKQTLWIGTTSGLDRYNPETDAFERIWINGGRAGNIYAIYEDRKGNIWIGSTTGLHLLTDRYKKTFRSFNTSNSGIAGNTVRAICEDRNGRLWVGTDNGLTKMQRENDHYIYELFRHEEENPASISESYITAIAEDGQGRLWAGTQNAGVNLLDARTGTFTRFLQKHNNPSSLINNHIRKILFARGKIWVGTQEGISLIAPATGAIVSLQHDPSNEKSLSQNSVYSLFQDTNGSLWVGTYFGGANIAPSVTTPFHIFRNNHNQLSINNNVISSIVEDPRQDLWIGTEGGGLNFWNRTTNSITIYKNRQNDTGSLSSNLVKVVYIDKEGNPWAGTHGGGLNVLDRKTNRFRRYLFGENDATARSSEITSLMQDDENRFWVIRNGNILLFEKHGTTLKPLSANTAPWPAIQNIPGSVLYTDAAKNVWIGARPGLYRLSAGNLTTIDTTYNLNCICEDSGGNIWVGISYGGLAKYVPGTGQLLPYTRNPALLNANILGMLADKEGNLWLSTNNGLVKFTPAQNQFQTYTVSDGLAGNEFNYKSYLRDSRGEMFFGGFNGITSFFPEEIGTNTFKAPIVLTGLRLFNNPVEINDAQGLLKQNIGTTKKLVFSHGQDVFTIEFALLNFIKSNKNRYAYRLEGFDKNWNEGATASATYTHLPPGSYTFTVKGANNDGTWSDPVSIKITMLPPFWLTWWAYVIYAVLIAAVVFLVTRFFFLRALLKKEDELHQVKLNFFTNISHEIRTHLTLILTPVEHIMDRKEKNSFDHQQLSHVKDSARRLAGLVDELMDFRKAETKNLQLRIGRHDLIPFLQEIYNSFRELSLAKNIQIRFIHNMENAALYFDRTQLEKVFFNLLTNAFKFTPQGGQVVLQVEQKEKHLVVTVSDNGYGIAPQYLGKLFNNFFQVEDHSMKNTGYGIGLALSKHIVELHKGSISVESEPAANGNEGYTRFTVTLLQGNSHFEGTGFLEERNAFPDVADAPYSHGMLAAIEEAGTEEGTAAGFTIFLAEDNSGLQAMVQQRLQQHYRVLAFENGMKAWEAAAEQIPDIVISDVMMPEMDGFTLCKKLKTDERTSHIPVILLTAKSTQTDQVSGLETGADVYITKPFSIKVLELNVRNLLAAREAMQQKLSRQMAAMPRSTMPEPGTVQHLPNNLDKEFLDKLVQHVEEHMDDPEFGVEKLSRLAAMSAPVLYRKIKALTGLSVNEFVKSLRLKKAAELLLQKKMTVYEVAYSVGYADRKYFSKEFRKQFGKAPSEYADSVTLPGR